MQNHECALLAAQVSKVIGKMEARLSAHHLLSNRDQERTILLRKRPAENSRETSSMFRGFLLASRSRPQQLLVSQLECTPGVEKVAGGSHGSQDVIQVLSAAWQKGIVVWVVSQRHGDFVGLLHVSFQYQAAFLGSVEEDIVSQLQATRLCSWNRCTHVQRPGTLCGCEHNACVTAVARPASTRKQTQIQSRLRWRLSFCSSCKPTLASPLTWKLTGPCHKRPSCHH